VAASQSGGSERRRRSEALDEIGTDTQWHLGARQTFLAEGSLRSSFMASGA
jgi:hypothetical protein